MVTGRGAICWTQFGDPRGSAPARRRPAVVVQADAFNQSGIATIIVAPITSNTALAEYPGNVFLPASVSGLDRDSVINVTQLMTVDRGFVGDPVGQLVPALLDELDAGLRRVLAL